MRRRQAIQIEALIARRRMSSQLISVVTRVALRQLTINFFSLRKLHLSIGVKLLFRLLTRGKVQVEGRVPFPTRNSPGLRVAPTDMLIQIC